MGTDRMKEFSGPCRCGAGTFEIDYCTPDHSWPVARTEWYESRIACDVCATQFEILRFGESFSLVAQAELQEIQALKHQAYEAGIAVEQLCESKGLYGALTTLIDGEPSLAAKHRLLTGLDLEHCSVATFRNRWAGSENWARKKISAHNVKSVMEKIEFHDADIDVAASSHEQLLRESERHPTPVGAPIHTIE